MVKSRVTVSIIRAWNVTDQGIFRNAISAGTNTQENTAKNAMEDVKNAAESSRCMNLIRKISAVNAGTKKNNKQQKNKGMQNMIKMFCDICGKSQQERKIYGISKKHDNMLILTQDHPVGWDPHPEECETHICADCLEKIIPSPERNENKPEDLTEGNEKDE